MELIGLLIVAIPLFFPLIGGLMAKSFGRSFWVWFFISCLLPFVSCFILVCLPYKKKKQQDQTSEVVENDEIFNHLFEEANKRQRA